MDMGKEAAVKCPFCGSDYVEIVGSSDLFDEAYQIDGHEERVDIYDRGGDAL
jgi:hypothetical protein